MVKADIGESGNMGSRPGSDTDSLSNHGQVT